MKKIIALTLSLIVIVSILNISVFAKSEPMTVQEFYAAQSDIVDKWVNGDITYSEWYERQNAILDAFYSTNQSVGDSAYATALAIGERFRGVSQKVSNAVEQWGDGARDRVKEWWNNVCNKNNVPTETTQTSSTDIGGYGALAVCTYTENGKSNKVYYYCDYITVFGDDSNYLFLENSSRHYRHYLNGEKLFDYNTRLSNNYHTINDYWTNFSVQYYGDVRYQDGTQAPTDDEFEYGTIKKFEDMPEKDLEDLLNDFAEEAERQNPDLSNLEGLLNAIYARLGNLDSDDDGSMLSAINAAIISLASDNNANNAELLDVLKELRDKKAEGADLKPVLEELKEINKSLDYL